ncbi:MAG: hypothetical protein ACRCXT_10265 [Paraclostridium sp.]
MAYRRVEKVVENLELRDNILNFYIRKSIEELKSLSIPEYILLSKAFDIESRGISMEDATIKAYYELTNDELVNLVKSRFENLKNKKDYQNIMFYVKEIAKIKD